MKRILAILLASIFLFQPSMAVAAPTVATVQKEIDRLRTSAADKFEAANEATIKIAALEQDTKVLRQRESSIRSNLEVTNKVLGRIAVQNYQGTGFGAGLELLMSSDPSRYLSDASTIKMVGNRLTTEMRKYAIIKQKVQSSQLVIADRMALLRIQKSKLNEEVAAAKAALAKATRVLNSLTKENRKRLLIDEAARENKILQSSQKYAASYVGDSSRGSIALKFALKQIGDIYVWAAAGPTRWDCSGLTMRAYQAAGVSLPHSAAIQIKFGKSISYSSLKPGDLLFFGRPISHVSIYVGGGKMVQAPRPGKKVEVVQLVKMFGSKPFVGAQRL